MPLVIWVGNENGSRTALLLQKMRNRGLNPTIAFGCGSPDAVKSAVINGAGVGILVCDAIQDDARRGEFAVLKIRGISLISRTYILWQKKQAAV